MADAGGLDLGRLALERAPPRASLFSNFQAYARGRVAAAQREVDDAEADVARIASVAPTTMDELQLHRAMLTTARDLRSAALGRAAWLHAACAIPRHKSRTKMTTTPAWSFAGDLLSVANQIESIVSETVLVGRGAKDDLPLVYLSNPPRHGKSLLLDCLFPDEVASGVCVLNATYNAATQIGREDLGSSAVGALRGLVLRLLNDLVFDRPSWDEIWDHSPLSTADNPIALFREMLGLDGPSPPKLLICIDEISKLLDHEGCAWARDPVQQKVFWRGLYTLTRASSRWARVVMTGFTDSPHDAVTASDVSCRPFSLSMISGPEQELLAAELMWAYAIENTEPFPGLVWALTKSTPGLLGLWAQLIKLHRHENGDCHQCAPTAVPDPHATGVMAVFRECPGGLLWGCF